MKILIFLMVLLPVYLAHPQRSWKCLENGIEYDVGAKITTSDPCENCECAGNGRKICFVQDCVPPHPGCNITKGLCCSFECPKIKPIWLNEK